MGAVHENLCAFVIISHWILFRVRNFSDGRCRENQSTHFVFNNFFQKSHHVWDNVGKYGRAREVTDGNIMCHIHFAYRMTMARIQTPRLRIWNTYCLSIAISYMSVPKYCIISTSPILACWSLITRTAADISKINLQAVAPCPVRTTICVVAMTGCKRCITLDWRDSSGNLYIHDILLEYSQACFPYVQYIVKHLVFDALITCWIPFCFINTKL